MSRTASSSEEFQNVNSEIAGISSAFETCEKSKSSIRNGERRILPLTKWRQFDGNYSSLAMSTRETFLFGSCRIGLHSGFSG